MKDRTLLLAGLVDDDDFEITRQNVVESYEDQLKEDRKTISENVSFIEEDELRFIRLIGEDEEDEEWVGDSEKLNENITMGGYGPGFAGAPSYALSSHYRPSQSEAMGQIVGSGYHKNSGWNDLKDPRIDIFNKIAESNPGAFRMGVETINEDELPEFDENFNPIISETEGLFFSDDGSRSALQEKIDNGEFAVQGGLGPGFEAYDGVKREIVNPYKNANQLMSRWYLGEMKEQPDLPGELEDRENINYFGDESEEGLLPKTINLTDKNLSLLGKDQNDPETFIYSVDNDDVKIGVSKDVEGWYAQARDSIMGLVGEGYGDTPEEAIEEAIGGYTGNQQEFPGELQEAINPNGVIPRSVKLGETSLSLVGRDKEDYFVYSVEGQDIKVGVSKDVEGWYAQVRDPMLGLSGEGYGDTLQDAIADALAIEQGTTPAALEEATEGSTDSNPWYYRRTGGADGNNVRYRENDDIPRMHPEAPEEPSSKGYPGLTGWSFYDGDHTYQKIKAKMNDLLDYGEATAEEEAFGKLFKKNSIYDD